MCGSAGSRFGAEYMLKLLTGLETSFFSHPRIIASAPCRRSQSVVRPGGSKHSPSVANGNHPGRA